MTNECCKNTDTIVWPPASAGPFVGPRISVTESGAIGIEHRGLVIVKTAEVWHALALAQEPATLKDPYRPQNTADCSPPDMPTAAAPAGLSAEPRAERTPAGEPYVIPVKVYGPDGQLLETRNFELVMDEPTREPSAIQRVCHALTGGCVMITDPERAACTSENCLAMRAAENRGGEHG